MALSTEEVARRYGNALFGFAQDQKVLDDVYEGMQALKKALQANPRLISLLSDPIIRKKEKKSVLQAVEAPFSEEIKGFLNLLLDYDRFGAIIPIIDRFSDFYDKFKGIGHGTATTAVKLNQDQLERMGKSYAKKYHLNSLQLVNKVDPEILGGVILQVEDRVIDGSVKNRLNKIRTQLTNNR